MKIRGAAQRLWDSRAAMVLVPLVVSACVTQPAANASSQAAGIFAAPTAITIGLYDYIGGVSAGPDGMVLTATGAETVSGASVKVFRPGLTYAGGLEAKTVAKAVCERAGGRYDTGAVGRFVGSSTVASGNWIFDGACT